MTVSPNYSLDNLEVSQSSSRFKLHSHKVVGLAKRLACRTLDRGLRLRDGDLLGSHSDCLQHSFGVKL